MSKKTVDEWNEDLKCATRGSVGEYVNTLVNAVRDVGENNLNISLGEGVWARRIVNVEEDFSKMTSRTGVYFVALMSFCCGAILHALYILLF